ncbi:MAG: nucleotidyltransferase domain-containing protein [bacterium]|nr:nucleotidyltransferase domain-containing protein [bacterium]
MKHLLYSEVFAHPLNQEELLRFSGSQETVSYDELHAVLSDLKSDGLIVLHDNHACLFEAKDKIHRRAAAAERADNLFDKAVHVASFIHKFPFVEGVGISGSLSKGILHDDGDFDFFIIVKPHRVWVARTLLILYKKVFLLNSRKYFCVNYFIDSDHLEIEEKNRFTAVEVATLIPTCGEIFDTFYNANTWANEYFPGKARTSFNTSTHKKPVWSRILQGIFSGRFGNWSDKRAMRITLKRWKKKFGDFDDEKFNLTMKSRRYVSKHHPNDFQNKVLSRYEELCRTYSETHASALKKQGIEL